MRGFGCGGSSSVADAIRGKNCGNTNPSRNSGTGPPHEVWQLDAGVTAELVEQPLEVFVVQIGLAAAEVEQELGQHQQGGIGSGKPQLVAPLERSGPEIELVAVEHLQLRALVQKAPGRIPAQPRLRLGRAPAVAFDLQREWPG